MRIVQVLGSSAGGVARHVAQVAGGLAGRGDDVRVVGPTTVKELAVPAGVTFAAVEIVDRPRFADARTVSQLRAAIAGADVVHAHGLRAGAMAVFASRIRRTRPRIVVTLHNLPVGSRAVRAVSAGLEWVVARGADSVMGVSLDLVGRMTDRGAVNAERALVPAPSLVLGPANPLDRPAASARTRAGLGIRQDSALIVAVARLAPQKGLDVLVDAAAHAQAHGTDATWVVAGGGPLEADLATRAASMDAPVRLLGPRDDVGDLLLAADVVVSTAVWEGQPIGIQEALGAGSALVVTDAGGTREVTGSAAVVVPVGDVHAVSGAVSGLVADLDARELLRDAARKRFLELPRVDDVLDQLSRVYRDGTSITL